MTVWKFPLSPVDDQEVQMPVGAEVLHVGEQNGWVTLWALVDPDAGWELRRFVIAGTGNPSPSAGHVGSVITEDGRFVWHVFDASEVAA